MHWLQTLDLTLFRFINLKLMNPVLDVVMPFLSGNALFYPVLVISGLLLLLKGGARGRLCVLMLAASVAVSDGFVSRNIKHAVGRLRPYEALEDVHRPGQEEAAARAPVKPARGNSMPSSHAANWFAATMVALVYYRRSLWLLLPLATLVSLSRIYNGVHYPSDVAAGALLGAGSALATLLLLNMLWGWVGRKWLPLWWEKLPSLLTPQPQVESAEADAEPVFAPRQKGAAVAARHVPVDEHWLRLGYVAIAVLLVARLAYLASGAIELSEDEAYQWLWSKHLDISYYSKPPFIAYTQFLGTSIWGDSAFGIRFFSPVITAILSLVVLRFFAREVNARAGFFLLLIVTATPLMSVGAVLMTVDPLSVLFWSLAMLAGWRAIQDTGAADDWAWVGLWMGLGFLSKYTGLLQLLCWAVFFVLWRPARKHLRRAGPYLALLINLVCATPVLLWNYQHQWVTVTHVAADAGAHQAPKPLLKHLEDVGAFLGSEFGLLNPVFFVATVWAAIAFWRRNRHDARLVYFFSMGMPLFLVYLLQSFRARVLPNWIAPAVLPLFCLMVIYWDTRWRLGAARIKGWLTAGLALGFAVVIVFHDTNITRKLTGHFLPLNLDPLYRVRVWSDVARVVGQERTALEAEGKPAFIIADHYGIAGLVSFYLPEAREKVTGTPLVYCRKFPYPKNQFHFWPGYELRKGENAIFVKELSRKNPQPEMPPPAIVKEFESVTDLGVRNVLYHGQLCRPMQVFACRGLR